MGKKSKKKEKHIPIRMCIVTRDRRPKSELMRIVRVDNEVKVDPKGKERGRGANITMDINIFDEAVKKRLLERSLNLKKKLSKDEIKSLRNSFIKAIEERKFRKGRQPVVLRVGKNGKTAKVV